MSNIIVVFPKRENAVNIRNSLVRAGIEVSAVCLTGAKVLQYADNWNNGMIQQTQSRKRRKRRETIRKRDDSQRKIIDQAKALLIERNNMSEEEAHRYLQKSSMESGTNMLETAQMVLTIMNE